MEKPGVQTADVVVLGAGLAGHCAAIAASEAGASVLLLEKQAAPGGSTAAGPGSFAFAGTDLQREAGVPDGDERLREDLLRAGGGKNRPELVDAYVERQLDTYYWLRGHGIDFQVLEVSAGQSVPRSHPYKGADAIRILHAKLLSMPGSGYLGGVRAKCLLSSSDGAVQGVELHDGGEVLRVRANRAVVICTGGFARSDRIIERYAPFLTAAIRMGGAANEGDGLLMAQERGADVVDTGYLSATFGGSLNGYPDLSDKSGTDAILLHPIYVGGIAVNCEGVRFVDESIAYKVIGTRCLEQPNGLAFQIFDQAIMDKSVPIMLARNFKSAYEKGLVRRADTVKELAATVNIDARTLEQTVERYNGFVRSGHDPEFGRRHVIGAIGSLPTLDHPPYYIYPCTTALLSTYGGLAVDARMNVLDVFGERIDRLFAAGEVTGGFHGASYVSGTSLGKAAVFGRLAGANAAALRISNP